jgi:hypothetical protein
VQRKIASKISHREPFQFQHNRRPRELLAVSVDGHDARRCQSLDLGRNVSAHTRVQHNLKLAAKLRNQFRQVIYRLFDLVEPRIGLDIRPRQECLAKRL